jgi:hypothetical protein
MRVQGHEGNSEELPFDLTGSMVFDLCLHDARSLATWATANGRPE